MVEIMTLGLVGVWQSVPLACTLPSELEKLMQSDVKSTSTNLSSSRKVPNLYFLIVVF